MKTFKIGNWIVEFHFSIKRIEDLSVIDAATELILQERKLAALKKIKTEYEISLKDSKDILDRILWVDYNPKSNRTTYKFLIKKDKKTIKKFLTEKLYKYDKK